MLANGGEFSMVFMGRWSRGKGRGAGTFESGWRGGVRCGGELVGWVGGVRTRLLLATSGKSIERGTLTLLFGEKEWAGVEGLLVRALTFEVG